MDEDKFVMINPNGEYATRTYKGGGFAANTSPNDVRPIKDLQQAYIFKASERTTESYKQAVKKYYMELPVTEIRTVTINTNKFK